MTDKLTPPQSPTASFTSSSSVFPPIQPGGSLIIAWQLHNRHVLLVGGGVVASGRLIHLLTASTKHITIIAPKKSLHPLVSHHISSPNPTTQITYHDRTFLDSDISDDIDMVLTAIDDNAASTHIYQLAKQKRIPVNVADVPPECDFYFGSMIRRGPLQVMVSTNGKGPKLANLIRRRLEDAVPDDVEEAIDRVGQLRAELRVRAPGVGGKLGNQRMNWMSTVCETWSLEELAKLDDVMIDYLLDDGWDAADRCVPSYDEARKALGRSAAGTKIAATRTPSLCVADYLLGVGTGLLLGVAVLSYWHRS